ncbi:hypothetical protein B0H63DRAFT_484129 [Podospora didyma]|uniref:Uncharacterized protein n=1 Tax=Podospora didyma TaxID=330526 RepID=A0AAE0K8T1_9PEZI|nr:hypothetical protein B0H63DRAFT_484129 [Podospora didyma]
MGAAFCTAAGLLQPRETAFKAMFVGDFITQGAEVDYAWRYRLWEWLKTQNVGPEFFGPWIGTHGPNLPDSAIPKPPLFIGETEPAGAVEDTGAYASGLNTGFTQRHAGMPFCSSSRRPISPSQHRQQNDSN